MSDLAKDVGIGAMITPTKTIKGFCKGPQFHDVF
jgi:hypothetical protein